MRFNSCCSPCCIAALWDLSKICGSRWKTPFGINQSMIKQRLQSLCDTWGMKDVNITLLQNLHFKEMRFPMISKKPSTARCGEDQEIVLLISGVTEHRGKAAGIWVQTWRTERSTCAKSTSELRLKDASSKETLQPQWPLSAMKKSQETLIFLRLPWNNKGRGQNARTKSQSYFFETGALKGPVLSKGDKTTELRWHPSRPKAHYSVLGAFQEKSSGWQHQFKNQGLQGGFFASVVFHFLKI